MSIDQITGTSTPDDGKESLAANFKGVVNDTGHLLKAVAASGADELAATRDRVSARLSDAQSSIADARLQVAESAKASAVAVGVYARIHPWQIIGLSAATGFVTGLLFSRRH
ncbi:DUF883 family protein [Niveibacterium sp. SC-1]|uniref:DUF883 family protein n=1 Tax=Niveibacterium sp. SC-1 TaxID=3135646 RepID=UPI00311F2D8E